MKKESNSSWSQTYHALPRSNKYSADANNETAHLLSVGVVKAVDVFFYYSCQGAVR